MISIVTINLNNSFGLKRTIESLKMQRDKDFEWILIDGASDDDSLKQLSNIDFTHKVISEPDNHIYDAMNKGINYASGKYLLFLNSGDIFINKDSMSILKNAYTNFSDYDIFLFGFKLLGKKRKPKPLFWRYWSLPTSHQSILYKRDVFDKFKYSNDFHYGGDFEHFLRIFKHFNIKSIKKILIENEAYGSANREVLIEYEKALKMVLHPFMALIISKAKLYYFFLRGFL